MENTFYPPNTNCTECIFSKETQCRLDKIRYYKTKGVNVETINSTTVLKNFICPYFRNLEWLENKKNTVDLVKEIQKENQIPYYVVLLNLSKSILIDTINKIKKFRTLPKHIYIVCDFEIGYKGLNEIVEKIPCEWTYIFQLEENGWHNIFKTYNRTEFMVLINGYPEINNSWTKNLSTKINDSLLKFSYAENKQQKMTVIPAYIYNSYYFEYTDKWLEKLRQERWQQKYIL